MSSLSMATAGGAAPCWAARCPAEPSHAAMAIAATLTYSMLLVFMSLLSLYSASGPPARCPGVDGGIRTAAWPVIVDRNPCAVHSSAPQLCMSGQRATDL